MIIVLLITSVIFVFGGAALNMGLSVKKTAVLEVHQEKALYIAEAGLEKALSEAIKGPAWLRDLETGGVRDFLAYNLAGGNNYGDGSIEKINIKKMSEGSGVTNLEIESWGRCMSSIKKVKVNVSLYTPFAEYPFRGVWLKEGNFPAGHCFSVQANTFFSEGDVLLNGGTVIQGNIYCRGKACFESDQDGAAAVYGDIFALDGIDFRGDEPPVISGYLYVDALDKAPLVFQELINVIPMEELISNIPGPSDFPDLLSVDRLAYYRQNADFDRLPAGAGQNLMFQQGVYFLEGDQNISGTYSGNATLVVNGSVTLGSLKRNDESKDSLAIISAGEVRSSPDCQEIHALIFAGERIYLNGDTLLKGSIVSPVLEGQGDRICIEAEDNILKNHKELLNYTTCFSKINRWVE